MAGRTAPPFAPHHGGTEDLQYQKVDQDSIGQMYCKVEYMIAAYVKPVDSIVDGECEKPDISHLEVLVSRKLTGLGEIHEVSKIPNQGIVDDVPHVIEMERSFEGIGVCQDTCEQNSRKVKREPAPADFLHDSSI